MTTPTDLPLTLNDTVGAWVPHGYRPAGAGGVRA